MVFMYNYTFFVKLKKVKLPPSINKKSEKHWGPRRNGGGKVVGVVPTKYHPNQIKIAKVCFWGGFWVGGVVGVG